jgi:hypothetical protein
MFTQGLVVAWKFVEDSSIYLLEDIFMPAFGKNPSGSYSRSLHSGSVDEITQPTVEQDPKCPINGKY